ncbi:MAG: hypothetical protein KA059_07540 [Elusimicrobiales bacterium]|jgi:hypothetical protein|nr:hypothetical protein [Elusimicrobiales bacterium]NLH38439.1 hypothetical protein [Elusimicrobiota bacterium]
MDCRVDKNKTVCNCTYEPCSRKGICCECISFHRESGEMPACFFSADAEKSYDRSIENFIRDWRKKNNY